MAAAAAVLEAGVERRRIVGACVAAACGFWKSIVLVFGRVAL